MLSKIEKELEKVYKGYKFKIIQRDEVIEILHNNDDMIGDVDFIKEVLKVYKKYVGESLSLTPVVVYDFLDEIEETNKEEVVISCQKYEFKTRKLELKGVTFFPSEVHENKSITINKYFEFRRASTSVGKWWNINRNENMCFQQNHNKYINPKKEYILENSYYL